MTTVKTTSTPTIPANSTVTLDPGSAYQLSITNTGTVTIGIANSDFERGCLPTLATNPISNGAAGVRGGLRDADSGCPDDGYSNVFLAPGQTRRVSPTGYGFPVTAFNGSGSVAGQVSLTVWSA